MQLNLVSALSLLAAISPALATSRLLEQLEQLSDAATDVRDILADVTPSNVAQNMPRVISTWGSSIAAQKKAYIEEFPQSVDEADIDVICGEFINYAAASQEFMDTLTGKAGLIRVTPFTQPINAVIDADFDYTKTFSRNIEGMVPNCKEVMGAPSDKLKEAYEKAQKAYSD